MTFFGASIPSIFQETNEEFAIAKADVFLREGPSTSFPVLGVIKLEDTIQILKSDNSIWSKVEYKGIIGFTSNKYIEEIEYQPISKIDLELSSEKRMNSNEYGFLWLILVLTFLFIFSYSAYRYGKKLRNKHTTSLLAFFGGTIGLHRFYLNQVWRGILYIIFSWTFLSTLIGIIDFISFLIIDDDKFDAKYNGKSAVNYGEENLNWTKKINEVKIDSQNSIVNDDKKEYREKSTKDDLKLSELSENSNESVNFSENDGIIDVSNEKIHTEIVQEEFEEVPYWPHQYIYSYEPINSASNSHKRFYSKYKSNFLNGILLDIKSNTNYAFILHFDLLNDFQRHNDINKLLEQFIFLGKSCAKTKYYNLHALIDILRTRNDSSSLEMLQKLENPSYQYEVGFSDYDPDQYKLGALYKSKLKLSNGETKLLNKFYNSPNVFNSIEGCCIAIIKQYLLVVQELESNFDKAGGSLNSQINGLQRLVKDHYKIGDNFYELKYINQRVQSETYLTIFKRVENSIRDNYRHNRKISDRFPYSENKLNTNFEELIGKSLDVIIDGLKSKIKEPDRPTLLELNSQNVSRWKFEFDLYKQTLSKGNVEEFEEGIIFLENVNQKNPNIKTIFYDASKTVYKYSKVLSLKYYVKYIDYDLKSDKVQDKQLTQTVKKILFETESQFIEFSSIIDELKKGGSVEDALNKLDDFYTPKRKKIMLNSEEIQIVESKHSKTMHILNKYLEGEGVEDNKELDSKNESEIPVDEIIINQNKEMDFSEKITLSIIQKEFLLKIANKNFSIYQVEAEEFALKNGIQKNHLIDSINEVCFDVLEGEVLIEEDEDCYIVEESYYREIVN